LILGVFLTSVLLVFGSFMNAGYTDIMQAGTKHNIRIIDRNTDGILFDGTEDLSTFAVDDPDIVVLLSSTDSTYNGTGILTVNPESTKVFSKRDLYGKYILKLIKNSYVDVREDAFLYNDDFFTLFGKVKKAYPSARIVPLLFQQNCNKLDRYKLSRLLTGERGNILVIADFNKINSSIKAINDLRDVMTRRVIGTLSISNVEKLAVKNKESLKAFVYMMHFLKAHATFKDKIDAKDPTISFLGFGDIMLDRSVRKLMDKNGLDYPFRNVVNELNGIDYIFANFEGPIKEHQVRTSKSISFRFKPDVAEVIKNTGINIVSIANNHALDQGWGGRDDTMKFLKEVGVHYFGHPKNEFEDNAYMGKVGDKTIAFIGFDDTIFKVDGAKVEQMVKELKQIADYVIVSVHWGVEYVHQPTKRKQWLAHLLVDSGADAVIGHHPHVVQTMEIYKNKPIFYSLGNFVFDQYFSQDTQEGLGVGMTLNKGEITVYLLPYSIPRSQPVFMDGEKKTQFLEKFISWGDYNEDTKNLIRNCKFVLLQD